jgi:hypothetical protein
VIARRSRSSRAVERESLRQEQVQSRVSIVKPSDRAKKPIIKSRPERESPARARASFQLPAERSRRESLRPISRVKVNAFSRTRRAEFQNFGAKHQRNLNCSRKSIFLCLDCLIKSPFCLVVPRIPKEDRH